MKKRQSGYVKVSRNLFETKEMRALKRAEKAEGIGVYMIIVLYLSKLENAIGDEFQCILLRKTFKVETTLGEFSDDAKSSADGTEDSVENSLGNSTVNDSGMISESSLHYNVRTAAGASPIKNSNIKDKSSSTGVLQRSTTTTTDFHDVVEKIFSNAQWLDLASDFQNSFSKNHPCCHTWCHNQLINRLIVLHGDRSDCHKMSTECHTKVPKTCPRGIKTSLRSIVPELRFCCFCLAEICSAKSRAMLTEIKSTFKYRYYALPVHYGYKTWSRGVSWSHFSTRNDFKKQPSLRHEA